MFADSDDYLTPNALELTVGLITRTNADIVQAGWYKDTDGVISYSRRMIKTRQYDNKRAIKAFLNSRLLGGYICSKLYRAELLAKTKFPADMSLGEDGVFAFHAFLNADKVVYTSAPIYYYRIRQDSLSMRGDVNFNDRDLDVFKQIDYIHSFLEDKGKSAIHKNEEKVFQFNLFLSSLYRYLQSDESAQKIYCDTGNRLKAVCDELWLKIFLTAANPRMKLRALQYGIGKRCKSR